MSQWVIQSSQNVHSMKMIRPRELSYIVCILTMNTFAVEYFFFYVFMKWIRMPMLLTSLESNSDLMIVNASHDRSSVQFHWYAVFGSGGGNYIQTLIKATRFECNVHKLVALFQYSKTKNDFFFFFKWIVLIIISIAFESCYRLSFCVTTTTWKKCHKFLWTMIQKENKGNVRDCSFDVINWRKFLCVYGGRKWKMLEKCVRNEIIIL